MDEKAIVIQVVSRWMIKQGMQRTIPVVAYQQLRRSLLDLELPDVPEVFELFGSWWELERAAFALAVLNEPDPEPIANPGPRTRFSTLAEQH